MKQKKVVSGSKYLDRAVKEVEVANDFDDDDRAAIVALQETPMLQRVGGCAGGNETSRCHS